MTVKVIVTKSTFDHTSAVFVKKTNQLLSKDDKKKNTLINKSVNFGYLEGTLVI